MNQLTWWDQFLVNTSNYVSEVWNKWVAISPDLRLAYGFAVISLLSLLLACVYKRRLLKLGKLAIKLGSEKTVAVLQLHSAQQELNRIYSYHEHENTDDETWEYDGGVKEEFVLELIGRIQSMNNEALDTLRDTTDRLVGCIETALLPPVDEEPPPAEQ